MRILRVRYENQVFYATLQENTVLCLNPHLGFVNPIPLEEVSVLPLVAPSKIIGVGVNYKEQIAALGIPVPEEPVFFMKPPSSIISTGQAIQLPAHSGQIDFAAELALVVGKTARNIHPEHAADYLFGFTCANDVTARDLQRNGDMYGRSKSFDTFCPIGPWIESEIPDPSRLSIRLLQNNEVMQESETSDMLFSPLELTAFISQTMTLHPGDIILTGTPPGTAPMHPGDEIRVEIHDVGVLINPVTNYMDGTESPDIPVQ